MLGMGSGEPARAAKLDAAYFDHWYADMAASPVRNAIVARTLGLPPGLQSTSLLTWKGIAEVTEALRMPQGGLLVDVACGRGGYGIEVARRAGVRLLGVDFSGVAPEAGQVEQCPAAAGRPVGLLDAGNGRAWRLSRGPERRCPFWLWRVWARWAWDLCLYLLCPRPDLM